MANKVNKFLQILNKQYIVLDGAMGTMIHKKGYADVLIPESLNLTHPQVIEEIHKEYINAGADLIYANTFGANPIKLENDYNAEELINNAIKIAKKAAGDKALVALDIGPCGRLIGNLGTLSFEDAYNSFATMVKAGEKAGCDVVVIETMIDLAEMRAAILAVKENSTLPIIATMTFEATGRTFIGTSPESFAITATSLGVDALGVNCSLGPKGLYPIIKTLNDYTSLPIVVKANAGLPDMDGNYSLGAKDYIKEAKEFFNLGASIVGGCCGTDPDYIKELKNHVKTLKFNKKQEKTEELYLCSSQMVVKADRPLIIGERLNPTGKPTYREALKKRDFTFVCKQALEQEKAGASILDLNVGVPGEDETDLMLKSIDEISSVTNLPLNIDSSNPDTLAKALRVYCGKAIVNSVNGEEEVLDNILPIVKKYGAAVIGLTLDNKGIPKTIQERLEIAKKIIKKAEEYGIKRHNIIIDTLTLTVAAEQKQALNTLNAIKELKSMGVKTVLGVSNISFGLPFREYMNSAFLVAALHAGLDFAIINPNIELMRAMFLSYNVIANFDKDASEYISAYSSLVGSELKLVSKEDNQILNTAQNSNSQNNSNNNDKIAKENSQNDSNDTLTDIVVKGLKSSDTATNILLQNGTKPLDVVNNYIIPALDIVGVNFEKGTMFLPQLIAAAESAKIAFEVLKKHLPPKKSGEKEENILVATVKGDIHDIGKNIVKTVLENYGFSVIDLGKNVEIEAVVSACKKYDAKIVGLSALMTTSLASMKKTIDAIKDAKLSCKIMVGGAVLTQEYADFIGADFYGKDAVASANYVKSVLTKK